MQHYLSRLNVITRVLIKEGERIRLNDGHVIIEAEVRQRDI